MYEKKIKEDKNEMKITSHSNKQSIITDIKCMHSINTICFSFCCVVVVVVVCLGDNHFNVI